MLEFFSLVILGASAFIVVASVLWLFYIITVDLTKQEKLKKVELVTEPNTDHLQANSVTLFVTRSNVFKESTYRYTCSYISGSYSKKRIWSCIDTGEVFEKNQDFFNTLEGFQNYALDVVNNKKTDIELEIKLNNSTPYTGIIQ